jgi:hypothetical protein
VAYTFQIENNKTNLLTEYENVTQTFLFNIDSILQNVKQLQQARVGYYVDRTYCNYIQARPSSETSVNNYQPTRRHIPESGTHHTHRAALFATYLNKVREII